MFFPKYSVSNRLLMDLIKLEVDLNILKNIEIVPEWKSRLKKESQVKRIVSCLRFEGVELNTELVSRIVMDDPGRDETVSEIAMRLGVVGKEKDLQFVINLMNANRYVEQVVYLSTRFKQDDLGEKELVQVNKLLGERLQRSEVLGERRTESFVENSVLNHPRSHEVPYQIEDLLVWSKSASKEMIHPLLKFVVLFYELLRIRVFLHGNFLTVLFFCYMIAGSSDYDFDLPVFEDELHKSKQKFFDLLAGVESSEEGLSKLMELVIGLLAVSVEKTRVRVMNVTGESVKYKTTAGRAVALTERQVALMEELTVKNQLTIKELRQVLPLVSDDTILRDLKDLVVKKMIRKKGKTKGAVYLLGKVKSFG